VILAEGRSTLFRVLPVSEIEQLVLYETRVTTVHGRMWLRMNGLLDWTAGLCDSENPMGTEIPDWHFLDWSPQMAETLTAEKREYVLRVAQDYLDEQFQRVNAILSDSTDPNCVEWEEAATLFQHLFRGLATYYLDEAELLDGESQEVMPAFAWNPEISLDGGNHEFILAASSDFSHERIVWAEIPGVRPESPDVVSWQDARRLVDLIGYATSKEADEIFDMHLRAMGQAADHLRFIIDKLRARVRITHAEMVRIIGFAYSILDFQIQLREVTG